MGAAAQLVVGMLWSGVVWATGIRKTPSLTANDIVACVPIGLCAMVAHGGSVTKSLKADKKKNMDSANVYAVMNILSFLFTVPVVVMTELPTLAKEWDIAVAEHGAGPLLTNIALSGFFFYIYNEFASAFTAHVGAVTSSVLNTAKRVIIIVISSILFKEAMERNTVVGSAIAISGTFLYSIFSKKPKPKTKTA